MTHDDARCFADIEINICTILIFSLFLFSYFSIFFNSRYRGCRKDPSTRIARNKNVTHSYLRTKLAYFTCYCFLYALRNAGASVLRVIRKPSEFKGTYTNAFETSARILLFPRRSAALGDARSVCKRMEKRSSSRRGVLVSNERAREKSGGGPFLVHAQAWARARTAFSGNALCNVEHY